MSEIRIDDHLNLIHVVLKKHVAIMAALNVEYEDAFQIGAIGLVKATREYNPSRGSFAAIATLKIRTELSRHYRDLNSRTRKANIVSLDAPVPNSHVSIFQDFIPDNRDYADDATTSALVDLLMDKLSGRERDILRCMYYGGIESRVQLQRLLGVSETMVYKSLYKIQKLASRYLGIKKAAC